MIFRIFITSLFLLNTHTAIKCMQEAKFMCLSRSSEMTAAHNVAASYVYNKGKEYIDMIAIIAEEYQIDPTQVVKISSIPQLPARRYFYDTRNNRYSFPAHDESYTARLKSGNNVYCTFTHLSPYSGEICALMDLKIAPIPLPIENFFVLRNLYLHNLQPK